jgi:hypothetical protein
MARAQGRDEATMAELRLRKNHSGERGLDKPKRGRAHRRVSRVANGKAKLTVALDGARAQRRPQNRRWTSADGGGGSRFAWAERESWAEGTNGRGEVGEQGARVKRGEGARTWPDNARTWARPRWGDRGREVRDTLTGGVGGAEREGAGARESNGADRPVPWSSERARERGRSGLRRQAGSACQAQGRAGARTRELGLMGCLGPNWLFLFSWNFYCLFYLFSLGFSIQIQIKFQIQTKSNICNNSKNN